MKHLFTGIGIGIVFLMGWLLLAGAEKVDPKVEGQPSTVETETTDGLQLPQRVKPVDLSGPFTFAGEEIPVADNFDVRTVWKDQYYKFATKQDCESIQIQIDPKYQTFMYFI